MLFSRLYEESKKTQQILKERIEKQEKHKKKTLYNKNAKSYNIVNKIKIIYKELIICKQIPFNYDLGITKKSVMLFFCLKIAHLYKIFISIYLYCI